MIKPVRRATISGFCGGRGAFGAGADGTEMIVGIDAGRVAVGERDLDSVVPYLCGGGGAGLGLEHRKRRRRYEGRRGFRQRSFLVAFVIAGGARTVVAQVDEVKVG